METIGKTLLECEKLAEERLKYICYISDVIKRANEVVKNLFVDGFEVTYEDGNFEVEFFLGDNGKIYVSIYLEKGDKCICKPLDELKVYYRVYITEHFLEQFIQDVIKHARLMSENI